MESSPLNDMRTTPPVAEEHRAGMSPIAIAVILLLLLIVGGWFVLSNRAQTTVTYDDQGNPITWVAPGRLVKGFPARFIVEKDVVVEESYTIDYKNQGNVLSSARYISTMSLEDNINAFGAIFVSEEWMVTVEPNYAATTATNFYALRGDEQINVVFVPVDGGIEVIISYVLRG